MATLWNSNYIKVWTANFMIFFSFMVVTPLLPIYLSTSPFNADNDTIGIVLSGYTLTALLIRPFSGYFVDSFPRKVVLLTCYFLFFALFAGYFVAMSLTSFAIVRTLHGAPMGSVTVANSTVAIDVLHPNRRAEGIGYYGLSNNLATAISPTIGLLIYHATHSFNIIFLIALATSCLGFLINSTVRIPQKEIVRNKEPMSLDRMFLKPGWRVGLSLAFLSSSYGVIATYLAKYAVENTHSGINTGIFFAILSAGLIISRLTGAKGLRQGKVAENVSHGVLISVFGYLAFALMPNWIGCYLCAIIVGLGNGHMFPGMQTMFINLAPNNQRGTANGSQLTAWDIGMGIGVLFGGIISRHTGYHAAFYFAWAMNVIGVIIFFAMARGHYLRHKLR